MDTASMLNLLQPPKKMVDVVLDTDTYNEIDDQFALSYLLRSDDRLNCVAICAAPFLNSRSTGAGDGMEKSYNEILKLLDLCGRNDLRERVFKGSDRFLPDEKTPVSSPAATEIVRLAKEHSTENPLYVVAIGAITNVASAILLDPSIQENMVLIWLGGNALEWKHNREFNLMQDVAAGRIIFSGSVPLVQLPCAGVVSAFAISAPELEHWLIGVNPLCDYLAKNTIEYQESRTPGMPWSKTIWDVTAVGWLLNEKSRFMDERLIHAPLPEYDHRYAFPQDSKLINYVWNIHRDALFADLFQKLKK